MSQLRRATVFVTCLASLVLVACGGGTTAPSGGGGGGTVVGKVTAADGKTAIVGATVTPASAATPSATTDAAGAYTLNGVAAGSQTLKAKKGNFQTTFTVTVKEGESANAPLALLQPTGKLAFVPGSFDSIESIVKGQLGNPMDQIQATQLGSSATLNAYRMIFLNCGLDEEPASLPATIQALKSWVEAGGTLYASDWALSYVAAMLPGDIGGQDLGTDVELVNATVTDSALQSFIGKSTIPIQYDLPGWKGLSSVSSRARVLLRGNYQNNFTTVSNRALAVVFTQGTGKIIYSTFHNENGATQDQLAVLRYYVYID